MKESKSGAAEWFTRPLTQRHIFGLHTSGKQALIVAVVLMAVPVSGQEHGGANLASRLERAAELIRKDRIADAEDLLTNILRVAPRDASALNLLGTIRAKQGKLAEAEDLFLRAAQNDKRFASARLNLAYLYLLRGLPEKTIAQLRDVLRLDSDNTEARSKLARLLFTRNQLEECINLIEDAKHVHAAGVDLLVLLGDAYLRKRNPDKAEENYLLALNNDGNDTNAVLGLAQVAQFKGENREADLYLIRARNLMLNSPETLYRFAQVALRSGAYEEANTALQAAIKIRSDEPAYFLALGTTWLKKPDLHEAEKAFRRTLQLDPESTQGQLYLGYVLLQQKRYPEARVWLEKSLSKEKNVPETFYYLGLIDQEENEDERAVGLFKKAIQIEPSNAFSHAALGLSYLKLRNYELARQELQLSIKLNPSDSRAHYNLAVLYARLKEPERAQEEMKIVEKLKSAGNQREQDNEEMSAPSSPKPR